MSDAEKKAPSNFIREIIDSDLESGKRTGVVTRFPPEPNGYLHIGHAKSICLNFGLAQDYNGKCNLRFDDTNPAKEEQEYIDSIQNDVSWLGFNWGGAAMYASDYFEQMYEWAKKLIKAGKAYVDDLNAEEIREYRGTLKTPGKPSPYRERTVEENLDLFEKMKDGEFEDGSKTLRAKIDLESGNLNMRDPVMYRIVRAEHPRQGISWCIYPMYDWAHGLEDSIEGITHSICTLEFEDHRPLYNWFIEQIGDIHHPQQIEFARLNINYTVMSKRKLMQLVKEKHVNGWDDPRMPTISGMKRRGYTPESIRDFCSRIGVAKVDSTVDIALLEHCLREDLNKRALRRMAVLKPLKLIIDNYPEGQEEWFDGENNPEDPDGGTRKVPFSRELWIEQEDFREEAPNRKYFRLAPGKEIRLKHAYYVTCVDYKKDEATGEIIEVHCTYDPDSRGGWTEDGRKVKGTSHWVSAAHAVKAEVRQYGHLFKAENPGKETGNFLDDIDPDSLEILTDCWVEPALAEMAPFSNVQFLRQGYFTVDPDSSPEKPVFNRTVGLRDTWAKIQKKG
ncbi:MAG: glutamine--tRNA ligase/YqeY domain fusion protein [Spirochaetales bacterium]|uniref:Glutamine--tRNA ligase n=1 Tax=Candidatus Thalassospirochaeta sargassi TaxID=3119039 RepID=A0AAJ1IBQ9_9SPIO|nr:glutamine--tRNA ligase/YqeY domain fusion protein [Spirochaetales bacterium]